jgi:hypothetical protein
MSALRVGNENDNWGQMMQIGKPLRTIVVEPLELPVNDPTAAPESQPQASEPDPEQVPEKQ